jgi:hypothetical protein
VNTGTASGRVAAITPTTSWSVTPVDGMGDRQGYDEFRAGTGKLLLPGEKISWDDTCTPWEITDSVEIGIWLYPEARAEEAKLSGQVHRVEKPQSPRHPPNSVAHTEGFR